MRLEYFQLIDRVTQLNLADLTICAEAAVPETSTIFEGHFPGLPLMPGVLLVESMAQTAGWLVIARSRFAKMPFLVSIKEAKLRNFVKPSQVLTIHAKITHEGSGYTVCEADIRIADKLICDAELTFRLMSFAEAGFRSAMEATATRIGLPFEVAADA